MHQKLRQLHLYLKYKYTKLCYIKNHSSTTALNCSSASKYFIFNICPMP